MIEILLNRARRSRSDFRLSIRKLHINRSVVHDFIIITTFLRGVAVMIALFVSRDYKRFIMRTVSDRTSTRCSHIQISGLSIGKFRLTIEASYLQLHFIAITIEALRP